KRPGGDLNAGVEIRVGPIVREEEGLALSSRNVYLDPAERKAAASLSDALRDAARAYAASERDPVRLRAVLVARLRAEPLADLEHADRVDSATFEKPGTLALIAAPMGKTR